MDTNFGIGERLYKLRKEKGLTAKQIADRLDISQAAVYKYEKNLIRPTITNLQGLAAILDSSVEYIMNGVGSADKTDEVDKTYAMIRRLIVKRSDLTTLHQLLLDFLESRITVKRT